MIVRNVIQEPCQLNTIIDQRTPGKRDSYKNFKKKKNMSLNQYFIPVPHLRFKMKPNFTRTLIALLITTVRCSTNPLKTHTFLI